MRKAGQEVHHLPKRAQSPVIKEWIAIGISGFSFIFAAGGYYFKVNELDRKYDDLKMQIEMNYVRKDVISERLENIQRQLNDQSDVMMKMDIKIDSLGVAVSRPNNQR